MLISNAVRGKANTPVSSRTIYSKLTTIYITKKIVKFGDVVYQFCNVSGFKITGVDIINPLVTTGIFVLFFIGLVLAFTDIKGLGFLLMVAALYAMPNIWLKKYGLEVSMNSGEKAVFTTNDIKGLKEVIAELSKFIESDNETENYVIDINDRNISFARYIENQSITWGNFGGSTSLDEHLNPPSTTYKTSANSEDAIAQTIACIREANLAGNLTVVVPATEATIHLVQIIKSQGLIANFELVADAKNKHLLLHLNSKGNNSSTNKITDRQFDWLNQEFPKEIVPLLQDLESQDPAVRAKAVLSLGEFYSERTK
ncbi:MULTISPECIES: 30S ribosomal protein S8 [unclassified Microcoleus]|uniref:30S ribosomal protein S8 n=1 Tax=unclassified Microcoleus TaxID=2642155 RepID=UPI0025D19635|nr:MULTISPECIES: 30S ribosomal protein S8 [unclassified Microcoleus]